MLRLLHECILSGCTELVTTIGPCSICRSEMCVDSVEEATSRAKRGQVAIYWRDDQSSEMLEELQRALDDADERSRAVFAYRRLQRLTGP